MRKSIAQKAADLLNGMGTAEEMRQAFGAMGYKGKMGNGYECPCGSCLKDHLGVRIYVGCFASTRKSAGVPLNDDVGDFTANFDSGKYPELIANTLARKAAS